MKGIIGYYSDAEYMVCVVGNGIIIEEVYQAGNHPFDSQIYLGHENGTGLREMRKYCLQTSKEISEEMSLPFLGIEREEE